ncbi:MAG: hypothetical protein RLZZ210_883 [Pseudomonadota bacterium]|jgi:hypothetical protein
MSVTNTTTGKRIGWGMDSIKTYHAPSPHSNSTQQTMRPLSSNVA